MAVTVQTYLNNPKWVKRVDESFDHLDRDKSGFLSRENWLLPVADLEKIIPDRIEMIAKARASTEEFLDALGLTKGMKADKEKYKKLSAALSISESERYKKGELTYVEKCGHAFFDAIDRDNNGYLSFDEYKAMLIGTGDFDEEAVQGAFNVLDKDKNGKLDKKEFAAAEVKFWCVLDDDSTDGMYGNKFQ